MSDDELIIGSDDDGNVEVCISSTCNATGSSLIKESATIVAEEVPIASLGVAETSRLSGEDHDHIRVIADLEIDLPPIIVHKASMRIIDGVHRFRAAQLRGDSYIKAVFFEGDETDAFIISVKANTTHGLPLTLRERTAAAKRILVARPHWSDRAIAACAGLATKTVAAIRQCSTDDLPQLNTRLGRDGKVRPTDAVEGRKRAAALMIEHPESSLREIARQAGVSPATVQKVREKLRRGEPVAPPRGVGRKPAISCSAEESPDALAALVHNLNKDPSLRFSDSGRVLLRLLSAQPIEDSVWEQIMANLPTHCDAVVARIAQQHAISWERFAAKVRERQKSPRRSAS
ncbi:ParB/RepB/Spo0J family partition protein [Nocardia brasiliensis]|uniref:ParB/RepB/Spo0J family partition protein n=1 Tax=Nocardia brasiliensis TaxID=37326 RepID=UPI0024584A59|nr:ParB N-terminal domain-containing protein [Nocardia brasiliensis]